MLRNTFPLSVLIDGHEGFGFSDQFMVEVQRILGTALGVSRDVLLELRVLGRLSITDFVVIWRFVVAHNLLVSPVIPAVECFATFYMDCVELCLPLPATNDGVDVKRIKL
jgi:hypothetical protein